MRDAPGRADTVLAVAGGYEFIPSPDAAASYKPPVPEVARILAEAYKRLDYDLVVLAPAEETLLRQAGVDIPDNWVTATRRPGMLTLHKHGLRIGVVVFPLPDPPVGDTPPALLMRQVADKAARLRERSDLVVGVSLWGGMAEKHFLERTKPDLDVLLGSGPGPGLAGMLARDGRTFWTRPTARGKSVNAFGLAALPGPDAANWRWEREKTLHLLYKPMDDSLSPDPAMAALFDKLPANTQK